jgi:hypothetical protein
MMSNPEIKVGKLDDNHSDPDKEKASSICYQKKFCDQYCKKIK